MLPPRLIRFSVLLACLAAFWPGALRAAAGGFSATLALEQKSAAGLAMLTAPELAALDQLVAGELARARQDQAPALAGTFSSRLTPAQRQQTGLERLTPEQRAKLDELVAAVVAARPQPKDRPRLKDSEVLSEKGRLRVHGSISLTYGQARGGRSFYGSSIWTEFYDPATGFSLGVGLSNYRGDGFFGYGPDYGYGYGYSPAYRYSGYDSFYDPRYISYTPRSYAPDTAGRSGGDTEEVSGEGASLRGLSGSGGGYRGARSGRLH